MHIICASNFVQVGLSNRSIYEQTASFFVGGTDRSTHTINEQLAAEKFNQLHGVGGWGLHMMLCSSASLRAVCTKLGHG